VTQIIELEVNLVYKIILSLLHIRSNMVTKLIVIPLFKSKYILKRALKLVYKEQYDTRSHGEIKSHTS